MTVAAETTAGSRRRPRRSLLRNPRAAKHEQLFAQGILGDVERAVRAHGPCSIERLAAILGRDEGEVLAALAAHPMIFLDGAGRYGIVAKIPPDFADPEFAESLVTTPVADHVAVTCPGCGSRHRVPAGVARKIARRARSARCAGCIGFGPPVSLSLGPLPREKFEHFARWWLIETGLSDVELRDAAFAFDCPEASIQAVATWRERLCLTISARAETREGERGGEDPLRSREVRVALRA